MAYFKENKKHLRVGLFGVSRSGKNYTIDDFRELASREGVKFTHLSPMDMIRARLGDRRLRDMSLEEKKELVSEVRSEIDRIAKDRNVIVDEHYCYPATIGGRRLENGYFDEKLPTISSATPATGRSTRSCSPGSNPGSTTFSRSWTSNRR